MCVSSPSITQVQRMQIEQEEELKRLTLQKKQKSYDKKYAGALDSVMKYKNNEKMLQVDWKNLVMYILPKIGATDAPSSSCKTIASMQDRLSKLPEHWSTYVEMTNTAQNLEKTQDISPESDPDKDTDNEAVNHLEDLILVEMV